MKKSLLKTPEPFPIPNRAVSGKQCVPIQKYLTALCTFDCRAMATKLSSGGLRR